MSNPTLKKGSKGDSVRYLQTLLNIKGFNLSCDGIFGNSTESAIRTWQKNIGLKVDGIAGAITWDSLLPPSSDSNKNPLEQFDGLITTFSLRQDGEKNISKDFKVKEFRSKCGANEIKIDTIFIKNKLQKIRDKFGKTIINSGYRTKSHNTQIGGSPNSRHMISDAFDISIPNVKLIDIAKYAEEIDIKCIIVYNKSNFVHLDNRPTKYFFYNDEKKQVQTFKS